MKETPFNYLFAQFVQQMALRNFPPGNASLKCTKRVLCFTLVCLKGKLYQRIYHNFKSLF